LFGQHSDPNGAGIFLPNKSTEVLDAIDALDGRKFFVCENEKSELVEFLRIYDNIAGIQVLAGPVHLTLTQVSTEISYGHIDYWGMLNSPATQTSKTLRRLLALTPEKSCFAFTHCDYHRGLSPYEHIEIDIRRFWGKSVDFIDYRNSGYVLLALCTWAAAFSGAKVSPLYIRGYQSNRAPMITCVFSVDASEVFNKELFLEEFLSLAKGKTSK
jgi:hypothetical protein